MLSIKKCKKCGKYTLMEYCNICKEKTITPHPPKFSLEKELKYEKYKRKN
ncbi:MAG: nucleolar RNA-binding Nop10p family protein [Candidatus Aenigmatarchaeota archaeon]|nr:ribosome biogenesis protein [Candidatus Aenigmarchaeota archaeon]